VPLRARLGLLALLATLLVPVAPAGAHRARPHAHVHANPQGRVLGVVRSSRRRRTAARAAGALPLTYNGGPVLHAHAAYAIYWAPPGYSFPAGYRETIDGYFANLQAAGATHGDVYAVDAQYTDGSGPAATTAAFAGSTTVTDALPPGGCPTYTGVTACLTDPQLESEISSVISRNGLPRGLARIYFIFTPPGVGSCAGSDCAYSVYCAYHSWFGSGSSTTLYANQPYAAVSGCDTGSRPNGNPADATLNVASHEHNETITDPTGDGWYDAEGDENGDKCAWTFGAGSGAANQTIGAGSYELQQEWDDDTMGCRLGLPTAAASATPSGLAAGFDASASAARAGTAIATYGWDFGDGTSGSGAQATHVYAASGTYTATLTVTDSTGARDRASVPVTVAGVAAGGSSVGTSPAPAPSSAPAPAPAAPAPPAWPSPPVVGPPVPRVPVPLPPPPVLDPPLSAVLTAPSPGSARALLEHGLPVRLRCSAACAATATLRLQTTARHRAHSASAITIASGRTVRADAVSELVLRPTAAARRALAGRGGVEAELVVIAHDAAGRTVAVTRTIVLRLATR